MTDVPSSGLVSLLDDHPLPADALLLADDERAMTRAEVVDAVAARATGLAAAGVGPGTPVGVALGNRCDFVVTMFAVWRLGAVLVPINARAPESERTAMLDATGAAVVVDGEGIHPHPRAADTSSMPAGVAFVTWTSGTTGRPRPIRHGHVEYLELLDRVLAPLRSGGEPRRAAPPPNLVPVALALNAGIYNVLFGWRSGAAVVILDRFEPARFSAVVAKYGIRSTVLPPAAITALVDAAETVELPSLRYVRSITAPLSPLAARRFAARYDVTVLNGYGQAELGEVIGWTAADAREHPEKLGAVGRAHPGVELRLADPGDDGIGRLLVRTPRRAIADPGDDPFAGRVDADGFVDTGDLARIDGEGFVWIEGRTGDLINRGGNKVFPDAVEEVLRLHPAVVDAAVVGVADARLGEVPVAFVVTVPGAPPVDELAGWCREHLVAYKVPVRFHAVAAIPRSEVGKILRRELVEP